MNWSALLGRKALTALLVSAGLLLVAGANAHLVYVAARSQPDCVAHKRAGDTDTHLRFSAAQSSCRARADAPQAAVRP